MGKIGLKSDYIKIINPSKKISYFGGNQGWFINDYKSNISRQGCGIISAIDATLYLNEVHEINVDSYKEMVYKFTKVCPLSEVFMHELFSRFAIGITPWQISKYLRKTLNGNYNIKWNGIHGHRDLLLKIEQMLDADIPVIWGLYSFKNRLTLYQVDKETGEFKESKTVNSHYVNAISVRRNSRGDALHRIMIEVSSWGRRYYIDFDEYLAYAKQSFASKYFSNLIIISPK